MVVWKFELRPWTAFIDMPRGARILHVGAQRQGGQEVACVWALCDPNARKEPRYIVAVPTGQDVPGPAKDYVASFTIEGGLVFHVFEAPAVEKDGVITTEEPAYVS